MVKKGLLSLVSLAISINIFAADHVDIYGTNPVDAQTILNKYSKKIAQLEADIQKETRKLHSTDKISKTLERNVLKKYSLEKTLRKKYGYLFVDFQTVFYPDKDNYYTTIEIVDKEHPERMRFVPKPTNIKKQEKQTARKKDVIQSMYDYNATSLKMLLNHQITPSKSCPVYHCTLGFEDPRLKAYLPQFNESAIKDKNLIIQTLKHDKNPERRAAAAFLVGHFQDPHEIVTVLTPSVVDKDDGVRNNVMRVIAMTLDKSKITDVDVVPFIEALDSPYVTDRNKALYVLYNAAETEKAQKIILQKGGERLTELLQLQQPNNHDFAYLILKKISAKDFGPTNIEAWKNWVSEAAVKNKII